ncbi:MAG: histidine kinase [Chitinophagaceae bacterium]
MAPFTHLIVLILFSSVMLMMAIYFLSRFNRLFTRIKSIWLRQIMAVWLIATCFVLAMAPISADGYGMVAKKGWIYVIVTQFSFAVAHTLIGFNIVRFIHLRPVVQRMPFARQKAVVLVFIVLCFILVNMGLNYFANDFSTKTMKYSVLYSFYNGCVIGFIYISMSYIELERKRKLNEKELEVVRLSEQKTKAELDALHSKVNPHFLYNALNSIADLSITDGRKARRMTIALADLFRYSINYSQNNYSTINDEVDMTQVYLEIEKIRFEDQLSYSVNIDEEAGHYLVPRFILQPLVENAVKHGLKATGQMTEIYLEVKKEGARLIISIADNGPDFPEQLIPGYGVKSVYDKLDLLFYDQYEIHFSNQPRKQVIIYIDKLTKNEPGTKSYSD